MFDLQTARWAFSLARAKAGSSKAARIAMMAITTSSSIRVKAEPTETFTCEPARFKDLDVGFITACCCFAHQVAARRVTGSAISRRICKRVGTRHAEDMVKREHLCYKSQEFLHDEPMSLMGENYSSRCHWGFDPHLGVLVWRSVAESNSQSYAM